MVSPKFEQLSMVSPKFVRILPGAPVIESGYLFGDSRFFVFGALTQTRKPRLPLWCFMAAGVNNSCSHWTQIFYFKNTERIVMKILNKNSFILKEMITSWKQLNNFVPLVFWIISIVRVQTIFVTKFQYICQFLLNGTSVALVK